MKIKKRLSLIWSIIKNADYVDGVVKSYDDEVRVKVDEFLSSKSKHIDSVVYDLMNKSDDVYITSDDSRAVVRRINLDQPSFSCFMKHSSPFPDSMSAITDFHKRHLQISNLVSNACREKLHKFDVNDPYIKSSLYKPIMDFLISNKLISVDFQRSNIPGQTYVIYKLNYLEK